MSARREERGSCLIEADALDLQDGGHWKPWLRLTRRANGVCASHTFDGLKPLFGTEQAALDYASELGRSLVDEGSVLAPASCNREIAPRSRNQALAPSCVYRTRSNPLAKGCKAATYMVRALAGIFSRAEFAGAAPRPRHPEHKGEAHH
jgi:hypothetical protein